LQAYAVDLKQCLIKTWPHPPQRVIDEAIVHWRAQLCACLSAKRCHLDVFLGYAETWLG